MEKFLKKLGFKQEKFMLLYDNKIVTLLSKNSTFQVIFN